jgi:hypothetical protein
VSARPPSTRSPTISMHMVTRRSMAKRTRGWGVFEEYATWRMVNYPPGRQLGAK